MRVRDLHIREPLGVFLEKLRMIPQIFCDGAGV
jgi:hypothetical protein